MNRFNNYPVYPKFIYENGIYKTNLRIKDKNNVYWLWPVCNAKIKDFIFNICMTQAHGIPGDIEDAFGQKLMIIDEDQMDESERLKKMI